MKEIITNKKFISVYLVWGLIHTTLLLIGKAKNAYKTFWPFSTEDYTESYDKSEWFFYMALPVILIILLNNSKDKNRLPILKSLFGKEDALIIETTSIAKEYIILVAEFVKLTRSFDKNIKINLEEENKEFFRTLFESRKIELRGKLKEDYDQILLNDKQFGKDLTYFIWVLLFLESNEIKERILSMPNEDLRNLNESIYVNIQKYAPEGQILSLVSFFKSVSIFLDYWKNEQAKKAKIKSDRAMKEIAFNGVRESIKKSFDETVTVCIKENSLDGSELDGVIILAAIATKATELKKIMLESKRTTKLGTFGFTDSEIDGLIEDGTNYVMSKYLKY
jgi:hypothetical protein